MNDLARTKYARSNPAKSLEYATQSLHIAEELADEAQEAKALHTIGLLHHDWGDYDKALQYDIRALNIFRRLNDLRSICNVYNSMGLCYEKKLHFDKARDYHQRCMTLALDLKDTLMMAKSFNNMGLVYKEQAIYDSAILYYQSALQLAERLENMQGLTILHNNLGEVYLAMNNYGKAGEYLLRAASLSSAAQEPKLHAQSLNLLGNTYLRQGRHELARQKLQAALDAARSINAKPEIKIAYGSFSRLYEQIGDTTNALRYARLYAAYGDTIHLQNNARMIAEMETLYDLEQKDRSIQELERKREIQDLTIRNRNILAVASFAAIILLAIFMLIFYRQMRLKTKINAMLKMRNAEILMQKEEIAAQRDSLDAQRKHIEEYSHQLEQAQTIIERKNRQLNSINEELAEKVQERTARLSESLEKVIALNRELDTFMYKASHDIKGPLVRLTGLCNLALMEAQDPVAIDYLNKMENEANVMREILLRLIYIYDIRNEELTITKVDLHPMAEQVFQSLHHWQHFRRIRFTNDTYGAIAYSDAKLLKIIFENLIENAIQFCDEQEPAQWYIHLQAETTPEGGLILYISDNGEGIGQHTLENLFEMFFRGSLKSHGSGMGLYITRLAVRKLLGNIELVHAAKPTKFRIELPPILRN